MALDAELVPSGCELCGSVDVEQLYPASLGEDFASGYIFSARRTERWGQHYRLVRCRGCGLLRSDPVLPEERALELYRESRFLYSGEAAYAGATYRSLLRRLLPALDPATPILEVGCGNGFFLDALFADGFREVYGVEPSREAVERASAALRERIDNAPFGGDTFSDHRFGMIASFHLLDHLYHPLEFLRECRRRLRPDGRMVLVCHDQGALSARLLGERSPIYDVEHIYLFDRRTVRKLFEAAGFVDVRTGVLWNTYPLGYWLRYVPLPVRLRRWIDRLFGALPVKLPAGNLYVCARRAADGE